MLRNSKVTAKLIKSDGTEETVTIYEWKRGDYNFYYKRANGSWITPYEFRARYRWAEGFGGLNTMFKVVYQDSLDKLIPDTNPLLKRIAQSDSGSLYHQPVVLGLEHGVIKYESTT